MKLNYKELDNKFQNNLKLQIGSNPKKLLNLMKKVLYVVNIILLGVLIYIIQYPEIQKSKIVKAKIAWYPSPASFPLFVAKEKGFFEEGKLEVEIFKTSAPEVIDNLKKGRVDIVVGFPPVDFFIRQRAEIENFRIMADVETDADFVYASIFGFGKLKSIKNIKNSMFYISKDRLEGKVIARKFEKIFGFDVKNLFEYSTLFPQIKEGGALVYMPFREYLIKAKEKVLVEDVFKEYMGEPYIIGSVFCSKVTLAYNPRAYERFNRIWDKAIDFIRNNPEEAKILYISYCIQNLDADFLLREDFKEMNLNMPKFKKTNEISDLPYLSIIRNLKNTEFIYTEPDIGVLFGEK